MIHPMVAELLEQCPFLEDHLDPKFSDLPTVAFGAAATALKERTLTLAQEDQLFGHFNTVAAKGSPNDLDTLGTGAIELFNDDRAAQRLARAKLNGRAREMLEEFRVAWGQPDYG